MKFRVHKVFCRSCTRPAPRWPSFPKSVVESHDFHRWLLGAATCFFVLITMADTQKVKVGYDKSVEFSKYKTYSWEKHTSTPAYPMLAMAVFGGVDDELQKRGLQKIEDGGELLLQYAGGIGFGVNQHTSTPVSSSNIGPPPSLDAHTWTGTGGKGAAAPYVPEGTLMIELVDVAASKIVWRGTVREKFDLTRKKEAFNLAEKAVAKLFKGFPPQTRR